MPSDSPPTSPSFPNPPSSPAERPLAIVLGASGRLGAAAVDAFTQAGWRVLAQTRRAPAAANRLASSMKAIVAPLDTAEGLDQLAAAAHGAQVVLHAVNPPYSDWARAAVPALHQGLALAERLDARFLLPGNVYNFGAGLPAMLRPDTPQRPTSRKGRIRGQMEADMQSAARRGVRCTVLRAGDFFGAGQGTWFDVSIVKNIARGQLTYPGPLDQAHAWAYLPDLARAFVAVAEAERRAAQSASTRRRPDFEILHFEGHTLTGAQLLDKLEAAAQSLGFKPDRGWRRSGMPWAVIRLGGWVVPMWREIAEMAYLWERPHALDGSALAERVGPLPSTPVDLALRQALVDLGLPRPATVQGISAA